MIEFDDLTEAELDFRALLERPTAYARWARAAREAWARTPAGQEAIAQCELRRGKRRRVVRLEDELDVARPSETSSSRGE